MFIKTLFFTLYFYSFMGWAIDFKVKVQTKGAELIQGLNFKQEEYEVLFNKEEGVGHAPYHVVIDGTFKTPQWILVANNRKVKVVQEQFRVDIPIFSEATRVDFIAIGPLGEVEKQSFEIQFKDYNAGKVKQFKEAIKQEEKNNIKVSLGVLSLNHFEEGVDDYKSYLSSAKIAWNKTFFPSLWDLGLTLQLSPTQISRSRDEASLIHLMANARLGYLTPALVEPWRMGLYLGMYYARMWVSLREDLRPGAEDYIFGYKAVMGPQIYPEMRYTFQSGNSITFFSKYSFVNNKLFVLSFNNREIEVGILYSWKLSELKNLIFTIDYTNLNLDLSQVVDGITETAVMRQNNLGFLLGIEF